MTDKKLTASLEDYLKEIYLLNGHVQPVRITDISTASGISKPSVNKAINILKDMGYLLHQHYGGVQLTEEGIVVAEDVIENHKICYKFLTQVLKVGAETAETEADQMAHVLSKSTLKKMKKFAKKKKKS